MVLLAAFFAYGEDNGSFTIIVGKEASADGSVLIAHNKNIDGDNFVDVLKITDSDQPQRLGTPSTDDTGPGLAYLTLQVEGKPFSRSSFSEGGLVTVAHNCSAREENTPSKNRQNTYTDLQQTVIERARSAREAVELTGKLIEKSTRDIPAGILCFADSREGWIIHVVPGKHWLACKVPDKHVAVVANAYTITRVTLKNPSDRKGSKGIIDYAVKKSWYIPQRDGAFNFARVFSRQRPKGLYPDRLLRGRAADLLAKEHFKTDEPLPFSFLPDKKIKITDLFRVLRDHYEGTEYDLSDDYKKGSPNDTAIRTICHKTTRYSFVAHLRDELPREMAYVAWLSFCRPDSNAYTPWYLSIAAVPEGYHRPGKTGGTTKSRNYAFFYFSRLSRLVDANYKSRIKSVRKEWKNFENYLIKSLRKREKEFLYILKKEKYIARHMITNYVRQLEYRRWFLSGELIEKILKKEAKR